MTGTVNTLGSRHNDRRYSSQNYGKVNDAYANSEKNYENDENIDGDRIERVDLNYHRDSVSSSKCCTTVRTCISLASCCCNFPVKNKVHTNSIQLNYSSSQKSQQNHPYNISATIPDIVESHNAISQQNCTSRTNDLNLSIQHLISSKVLIPIKHTHQQFSWDCGIACIMMILSTNQKKYLIQNLTKISEEEGYGKR